MSNILKQVADFNNSLAFAKTCKLVCYFIQALAVRLFLSQVRGKLL